MPAVPESTTFVLARGEIWRGESVTEPYEAGWAREAVLFLRPLRIEGDIEGAIARVQVSPDGLHWADEGTTIALPQAVNAVAFARIGHFGNWLRLAARLPEQSSCQVIATLHLKA